MLGWGCEMRGWGEGEGGGVDFAAPWMGRGCEIRGWGVAARCWDGTDCEMQGWGEGEGRCMDLATPWMTPLVMAMRDAGTG
jgi:hypothetical protein